MTFTPEQVAALKAPFPPELVSWRVGSTNADKSRGMALAYIDARDVMERLDAVCGAAGWQCRYPHANGKTVCEIGVKIGDEWVWKADGAGDTDVEAEKGALSDAFKRAAVRWGIGRYLYDLESPWVALKQIGRSYAIADSEYDRLAKLIGAKPPKPAAKTDAPAPPSLPYTTALAAMKKAGTRAELKDWYARQKDSLKAMFTDAERTAFVEEYTAYGKSLPEEIKDAA